MPDFSDRDHATNRVVPDVVIEFPIDRESAERLWLVELKRTANQARPRINRCVRDLHRELCGPRLPR
jgi:hypothetical protein